MNGTASSLSAFVRAPFSRIAFGVIWFITAIGGCTLLAVASHLGTSSLRSTIFQHGMGRMQAVGLFGAVLLLLVVVTLIALSFSTTGMRERSIRVSAFCAVVYVSGMPWTFFCAVTAPLLGMDDFQAAASIGGFVSTILWFRTLLEGWRGAAQLLSR